MILEISVGPAVVSTSQSFGRMPSRASRTAPPTTKEEWPEKVGRGRGKNGELLFSTRVRVGGARVNSLRCFRSIGTRSIRVLSLPM